MLVRLLAALTLLWVGTAQAQQELGGGSGNVPSCIGGQFVKGPATCATPGGGGNVSGPGSSTPGYLPTWGDSSGTLLTTGLQPLSTGGTPGAVVVANGSGLVDATYLPPPTSTTLGGIESFAAVAHEWINQISTAGVPSATQPAFSDLSGSISLGQLPSIANNTTLGNVSGSASTPTALSKAQLTTLVNVFSSSLSGAAPASGGGTTNFLRADGTWVAPAGSTYTASTGITLVGSDFELATIAATSVLANETGGSAAPTSALCYGTTSASTNCLLQLGSAGTVDPSVVPNPSSSTLGGIESFAAVAHEWINQISTAGVPSATQPAFIDISGQTSLAQLPSIANNTVLGNISGGSAVPAALTKIQLTALINAFSSSLSGAAPASGGGTTSFLRADGTWAAPVGSTYNANNGITLTGSTFGLTPIAATSVLANETGSSGVPSSALCYGQTSSATSCLLQLGSGGQVSSTVIPNPSASTLGGVESYLGATHQWIYSISIAGVPLSSQPAFTDISGQASLVQLPSIASLTFLGNTTGGTATPTAVSLPAASCAGTGGAALWNGTAFVCTTIATQAVSTWLSPVMAETAAALSNSPSYSNGSGGVGATLTATTFGALVVDGYTVLLNDSVLVNNQAAPAQNGIYTETTLGDGSHDYVLTRRTDNNSASNIVAGDAVAVTNGSTWAGHAAIQTTSTPPTVGTTAITWIDVGSIFPSITATAPITFSSNIIAFQAIPGTSVPANTTGSSAAPSGNVGYGTTGNSVLLETGSGGLIAASVLPTPTAGTLGGVESAGPIAHEWVNQITTGGTPVLSQPAFSDISGSATLAQLPSIANNTVLGNVSGGSAVPAALTTTQLTTLVNAFTSSLSGAAPASGGGTTNFLRADGTWAAPPGASYTASLGITLSGSNFQFSTIAATSVLANTSGSTGVPDVALCYGQTSSATSCLLQLGSGGQISSTVIPNPSSSTLGGVESAGPTTHEWINSISTLGVPALSQPAFSDISGSLTLAQLPSIGNDTVLGNVSGGSAAPSALTTTQLTTLCNSFTSSLSGCVPASGGGTTNFLRADGTWSGPPGATYTASLGITLSGSNFQFSTIAATSVLANTSGSTGVPDVALCYGTTSSSTNCLLRLLGTGLISATVIPAPTASTLGGVESLTCGASNWLFEISTAGVPVCSQPAFSNISGQATLAQLPTIANNTILGNISGGSATPIALNATQLTSLCNLFTSATSGCAAASGGGTVNFLRADGAWVPGIAASLQVCTAISGAAYTLAYTGSTECGAGSDANGLIPVTGGGTITINQSTSSYFPPGALVVIAVPPADTTATIALGAGAAWATGVGTAPIVSSQVSVPGGGMVQIVATTGNAYAPYITQPAGAGAVTSVGLALPAIFTVSGSPITSSGTLTGTLATQNANLVWAGPASGSAAAPTFRSLVSADQPYFAGALAQSLPNGSTGTTTNKLVIYQGGAGYAFQTATTGSTTNVVGICQSNCTTTGSAVVATGATAQCVFDNATTAADWVVASTTVAGDCHDAGATVPTGVQVLGQVNSTNASAGTYGVDMNNVGLASASAACPTCAHLTQVETFTAAHTFTNSDLLLLGSSTGATTFTSGNASGTNYTLTVPANTGTLAELNLAQSWTAAQTFTNSDIKLLGSSTGATTFTSANSGASNFTLTFPAVTDTLAALGTAQSWTAAQRETPVNVAISTATFTPNFNTGQNFEIDLTSACPCTLANPSTTLVAGQSGVIEIHQDSGGSRTIGTWGSDYLYVGGTSTIALSTGASAVDYLPYYVNNAATGIVLGTLLKAPSH